MLHCGKRVSISFYSVTLDDFSIVYSSAQMFVFLVEQGN